MRALIRRGAIRCFASCSRAHFQNKRPDKAIDCWTCEEKTFLPLRLTGSLILNHAVSRSGRVKKREGRREADDPNVSYVLGTHEGCFPARRLDKIGPRVNKEYPVPTLGCI